jgi:iron complex transport system substrate-binding protein
MTLNDTHMVSAAIRLCGGKNVFGALKEISPTVSVEALLAANPDAIITGGSNTDSLNEWRQFSVLTAAKKNHLYAVNGDWLNRAGPRILDGTEALCKQIAAAREK